MSVELMSQEALSNLAFEFWRLNPQNLLVWEPPAKEAFVQGLQKNVTELIFQILLAENLRALRQRYGGTIEDQMARYGDWRVIAPSAAYRNSKPDIAAIVNLCDRYNSEVSESPDYGKRAACKVIKLLTDAALRSLLDSAPESVDRGGAVAGFIE